MKNVDKAETTGEPKSFRRRFWVIGALGLAAGVSTGLWSRRPSASGASSVSSSGGVCLRLGFFALDFNDLSTFFRLFAFGTDDGALCEQLSLGLYFLTGVWAPTRKSKTVRRSSK